MNEKLPFDAVTSVKEFVQPTGEVKSKYEPTLKFAPTIKNIDMKTLSKLFLTDNRTLKAVIFKNGTPVGTKMLIPDIVDVKVISKDEAPKVVVVYFADNTSEKAVLDSADTYSLEQGISICITKKMFAGEYDGVGSSIYNKVISRAMKVMKNNEKAKEEEIKRIAEAETREKKIAEKKRKYREKVIAKMKEEEIQIQAESYYRALKKIQEEACRDFDDALKALDDISKKLLDDLKNIENQERDKYIETVSELNEDNK